MIKRIIHIAAIVCAGTALCCCTGKVRENNVEITLAEAVGGSGRDSVFVSASIAYPVSGMGGAALEAINKSVIRMCFGEKYETMKIEEAAERWAKWSIDTLKNDAIWIQDLIAEDERAAIAWESDITGYINGVSNDILSYIITTYKYSGGAHGMAMVGATNFSTKTGDVILEEDFFADGYKEELGEILSAHLEESLREPDMYDALFVKDIEPNGNFSVTDEGVTYIYQQYEIGPYYLGIIKVNVPYAEIAGLIRR